MESAKNFFTEEEKTAIVNAITEAEKLTSGEIRVHLENRCGKDILERTQEVFQKLKMHETAERNGVLIFIAVQDHEVAIWGDEGINEKVESNFWDKEIEIIVSHFKQGKKAEGLSKAILQAGENLQKHFPFENKGDNNELSNDISIGN